LPSPLPEGGTIVEPAPEPAVVVSVVVSVVVAEVDFVGVSGSDELLPGR